MEFSEYLQLDRMAGGPVFLRHSVYLICYNFVIFFQRDNVFVLVCLFVCLSVSMITQKLWWNVYVVLGKPWDNKQSIMFWGDLYVCAVHLLLKSSVDICMVMLGIFLLV